MYCLSHTTRGQAWCGCAHAHLAICYLDRRLFAKLSLPANQIPREWGANTYKISCKSAACGLLPSLTRTWLSFAYKSSQSSTATHFVGIWWNAACNGICCALHQCLLKLYLQIYPYNSCPMLCINHPGAQGHSEP